MEFSDLGTARAHFMLRYVTCFVTCDLGEVPVTFGCEASEAWEIYKQKPDGILGLGNSKGVLHAQVCNTTC
jgi:hypothetical protein